MSSGDRLARVLLIAAVAFTGCGCPRRAVEPDREPDPLHPWNEPACADPDARVLHNTAYDCCYSPDLRISRWVAYRYTRTPDCSLPRHRGEFRTDPRLDAAQGPTPTDFRGIWTDDMEGYDRGHQAPDATIKPFGPQAQAETYYLTNITPQHSRFNRGFWRDLEWVTRGWAGTDDTVWVITGPVFYAGHETLRVGNQNRVAVPHAYYSVAARKPGPSLLALLVPHNATDWPWDSASSFIRSVDSIEALTGLDLFPALNTRPGRTLEAAVPDTLWPGAPPGWQP